MSIWDQYGNWDAIARSQDIVDIKRYITGAKKAWRPNFCSPSLAYIFEYTVEESASVFKTPSALDFGCGLGRNGPLLRRYFPDVIGIDLPEMIDRFQAEYPGVSAQTYRRLYSSAEELVKQENISVLYDSVVFQHIVDNDYLVNLFNLLFSVESFRTFVSVTNATSHHYPHLKILEAAGWRIWHAEVETLSFEGAPHTVTTYRRW
jgi:trans-aconitate methyltransferase